MSITSATEGFQTHGESIRGDSHVRKDLWGNIWESGAESRICHNGVLTDSLPVPVFGPS